MSSPHNDRLSASEASEPARLGAGSLLIIIALLSLLVAAGFIVYVSWTFGDAIELPIAGYIAMAGGVIFSLAVGFGLMALLFYSSRSGYDEPPTLIAPENRPEAPGSSNKLKT